jgi:hypothetical protein
MASHICTVSFSSWFLAKWQPLAAFLRGPNKWYSNRARLQQGVCSRTYLRAQLLECLNSVGSRIGMGIVIQHLVTVAFCVYCVSPVSVYYVACYCKVHCLLSHPVPGNAQELVLENPRKVWASLFLMLTEIWTSFWWYVRVVPFRTLGFALWLIMVDSCLVTSKQYGAERHHLPHDTSSKGGNRCLNCYACAVPWGSKSILQKCCGSEVCHGWLHRQTMTVLHPVCHFIISYPFIVQNQFSDLFSVPFTCRCLWVPWSFFVSDTCLATFECVIPLICFIATKRFHHTVLIICSEFCTSNTFSPQKCNHCNLLLFVECGK